MAQAANVIKLPVQNFTFKGAPVDDRAFLRRYVENQPFVGAMVEVLRKNSAELKAFVAVSDAELGRDAVRKLVNDFEGCATEFIALAELFQSARARLSVVRASLV